MLLSKILESIYNDIVFSLGLCYNYCSVWFRILINVTAVRNWRKCQRYWTFVLCLVSIFIFFCVVLVNLSSQVSVLMPHICYYNHLKSVLLLTKLTSCNLQTVVILLYFPQADPTSVDPSKLSPNRVRRSAQGRSMSVQSSGGEHYGSNTSLTSSGSSEMVSSDGHKHSSN